MKPHCQNEKAIRTFVRRLELDPEKKEIRVAFDPDNVVHRYGAGSGT